MGYQLPTVPHSEGVVYEFAAGNRTIKARVSRFRGRVYLDLREWFAPEPGKPPVPTRRGVSVPDDCLGDLQTAIDALRAELERPGRGRRSGT